MENSTSLTIQSIGDDTNIHCRIYHPLQGLRSGVIAAAVVAHPYAPLGGCQEDHVVQAICRSLVELGLVVATFNFRGASPSGGWTSFSGEPETMDYRSLVYFLVVYLMQMRSQLAADGEPPVDPMHLVFAGYSYGSMIASRIHGPQTVNQILGEHRPSPAAYDRRTRAIHAQATKLVTEKVRSINGEENDYMATSESIGLDPFKELIQPSHLLVSPILPPITGLLTPLSGRSLFRTNAKEYEHLTTHPTLAIWGSEDVFTSTARLRSWATSLTTLADGPCQFKWSDVDRVGHFWQGLSDLNSLRGHIQRWAVSNVVRAGFTRSWPRQISSLLQVRITPRGSGPAGF